MAKNNSNTKANVADIDLSTMSASDRLALMEALKPQVAKDFETIADLKKTAVTSMLEGLDKEGMAYPSILDPIVKNLVTAAKIPVGLRDIIESILSGAYGKAYMSLASLLINHNVTLHQDTLEVEKVIYNVWLKEKSTRKRKDGTIVDDTLDADTPDVNLSGEVVELTA